MLSVLIQVSVDCCSSFTEALAHDSAPLTTGYMCCRNAASMLALHPDFLQQLKAAQAGTVGQIAQVCNVP